MKGQQAAMALKLHHVLAGERLWASKEQHQATIQHLACRIPKFPEQDLARHKGRTADSLTDGPGCRSGHAHNANPGVTRGGRYGSDRILVQRTSDIRLCRRRHVQSGGSQTIAEQRQGRC